MISKKNKRAIDGIIKGKYRNKILKYLFSIPFLYAVIFASMHYFLEDTSIFLNTYGVVMIDFFANIIYLSLSLEQERRDMTNICKMNKKIEIDNKPLLIDRRIGEKNLINGFKIVIYLCVTAILLFLAVMKCYFQGNPFMDQENAFMFVTFLLFVAYFDCFIYDIKNCINNIKERKTKTYIRLNWMIFVYVIVIVYQLKIILCDINLLVNIFN